jgi:hypothetical protein
VALRRQRQMCIRDRKKGKISFVIGAALSPQQLPAELNDYDAANWVKNHVYSLKPSDETNH